MRPAASITIIAGEADVAVRLTREELELGVITLERARLEGLTSPRSTGDV